MSFGSRLKCQNLGCGLNQLCRLKNWVAHFRVIKSMEINFSLVHYISPLLIYGQPSVPDKPDLTGVYFLFFFILVCLYITLRNSQGKKIMYNSEINNIIPGKEMPLKTSLCNSQDILNTCSTFFFTDDTASDGST